MAAKARECPINATYPVGPVGGRSASQFDNKLRLVLQQDSAAGYKASKTRWRLEIGREVASPGRVQAFYYVETTISWLNKKELSDDYTSVLCVAKIDLFWPSPEALQRYRPRLRCTIRIDPDAPLCIGTFTACGSLCRACRPRMLRRETSYLRLMATTRVDCHHMTDGKLPYIEAEAKRTA
jgi:hypothetical protein